MFIVLLILARLAFSKPICCDFKVVGTLQSRWCLEESECSGGDNISTKTPSSNGRTCGKAKKFIMTGGGFGHCECHSNEKACWMQEIRCIKNTCYGDDNKNLNSNAEIVKLQTLQAAEVATKYGVNKYYVPSK